MYLPESPQMPREEQAKAFPHKPYSRHTTIIIVDYNNNKHCQIKLWIHYWSYQHIMNKNKIRQKGKGRKIEIEISNPHFARLGIIILLDNET